LAEETARLQKTVAFSENHRKPADQFEFKNHRIHCFKILEKDKNQQNICKKTRSNSKVTGEEIFIKSDRLSW
jgi:hypothetical protein